MTMGLDDFVKDLSPNARVRVAAAFNLKPYVAAMGGKLRLVAEFPDRRPVAIALADILSNPPSKPRRRGAGGA